ncbi:MAG: response regulator [Eubacteriales bacterium]|nr:response regulator [Eubacteriales bacterium]
MNTPDLRETILVIEDSPIHIDLLIQLLGPDYRVLVFTDGQTGLSGVEKIVPDLVLLDILLPDIDGLEVCRQIKSNPFTQDIPVVILTSLTEATDEVSGLEAGASDFISKPFNPGLLKARIRVHLDLKKHRDRLDKLVDERTAELEKTKEAIIASLAILSEYRDFETGMHVQRTQAFIRCLAMKVWDLTGEEATSGMLDLLGQSAMLHDIGKVGIPDTILLKPGPLSEAEFDIIKKHPIIGADVLRRTEKILGSNTFLRFALEIAESHHERWDGSGYPHGLKAEQIPLSAQLMTLVDVYDALTSNRPYKKHLPHEEAVRIIREGDDRIRPEHFSPVVQQAFFLVSEEFDHIRMIFREKDQ